MNIDIATTTDNVIFCIKSTITKTVMAKQIQKNSYSPKPKKSKGRAVKKKNKHKR